MQRTRRGPTIPAIGLSVIAIRGIPQFGHTPTSFLILPRPSPVVMNRLFISDTKPSDPSANLQISA